MKLKISEQIFKKYPETEIGVIVARDVDNSGDDKEIQLLMREVEAKIRESIDSEEVLEIPSIAKWREIYKSFGAKPSKFRNSVEALIKRVVRGDEIYKINSLVDLYNLISIKYKMTIGGEEIDRIEGDLVLDFAKGNEEFIALGRDQNESPWEGEVVYKDNRGVVCRCWNYREADRTKLTKETKNAIIVIENNLYERSEEFKIALNELGGLIEKYCGARCDLNILNKDNFGGAK